MNEAEQLKQDFIKTFGGWNTYLKTICYVILKDRGWSYNNIGKAYGLSQVSPHSTPSRVVPPMRFNIENCFTPKFDMVREFYKKHSNAGSQSV